MTRYGLAIDPGRCTGCYACVVACRSENSTLPGVFWIRVEEREEGEYPAASTTYTPMLCMQCWEGPCAEACPTGAIHLGEGGIILIDEELCTCGDVKPCIRACPFGALSVNKGKMAYFPDYLTPDEQVLYASHRGGAVEKCNLCSHRISAGMEPTCVQSCPSGAMIFGDLDDKESNLAQLVSRAKAKPLREDLDLDPSVFYVRR